jgi:hypothetical protein
MHRKTIALIAVIAVSLVTIASLASAASRGPRVRNGWLGTGNTAAGRSADSPAVSSADERRIRAIFVTEHFAINTNPDGFDEFVVSGPLMNVAETRRIGFLAGDCSLADPAISECELTANFGRPFPQGDSISIHGLSSPATHWFNAITGGTGRFDDAAGELEARNIGSTNKVALVFHLEG